MRDRIKETKRRISRLIDQLETHLIPPSLISSSSHDHSTIDRASKRIKMKRINSKKSSTTNQIKLLNKLVGTRLRVEIFDRRTFVGRLICLDHTINLVLDQTTEFVPGLRSRPVGLIFVPIDYILRFEIEPSIGSVLNHRSMVSISAKNSHHPLIGSSQLSLESNSFDPTSITNHPQSPHPLSLVSNDHHRRVSSDRNPCWWTVSRDPPRRAHRYYLYLSHQPDKKKKIHHHWRSCVIPEPMVLHDPFPIHSLFLPAASHRSWVEVPSHPMNRSGRIFLIYSYDHHHFMIEEVVRNYKDDDVVIHPSLPPPTFIPSHPIYACSYIVMMKKTRPKPQNRLEILSIVTVRLEVGIVIHQITMHICMDRWKGCPKKKKKKRRQ